jgi:hypothetical protein
MPSLRDAYARFLGTADAATWRSCLDEYCRAPALSDRELAETLCLSIYVQWLGSLSGDGPLCAAAQDQERRLAALAAERTTSSRTDDAAAARAVLAAGRGYHRTAERILGTRRDDRLPVELALLILPGSPAKRARLLKGPVLEAPGEPFLPAVYFYALAQLDLGAYQDVGTLIAREHARAASPLLVDLQGKLFELTGAWADARDAYAASDWPVHRYRRRICQIIVGGASVSEADAGTAAGDEKLRQGMDRFETEIDQAEAARTSSFVNACRWQDFDNWLVDFELAKLSFQRRRHSEAERHFRNAATHAPEEYLLPINRLRFANLTWLGGRSIVRDLPVNPETIECGLAAIAAPGDEAAKSAMRTFIAGAGQDHSVLRPVFESPEPYFRATAHDIVGNTPAAMRGWCESFTAAYQPRTVHRLIRFFATGQFDDTVLYLVDLVMRESWDAFFDVWELAAVVRGLLVQDRSRFGGGLESRLGDIEKRLEELAQTDFQHAIRAIEFFADHQRRDIAAGLLRRASRLAETPEEYLELAMAQRSVSPDDHELGRNSLDEAERQSTDRLERLQIAREWARSGRLQRARNLLGAEGALDGTHAFEPIEYIVTLQCGQPCLSPQELEDVSRRAEAALRKELLAGAHQKQRAAFVERLKDHASAITLSEAGAEENPFDRDEASVWQSLKSSLERSKQLTDLEEEKRLLSEILMAGDGGSESLFFRYTVWDYLFRNIEALVEGIHGLRPPLDPSETPISRSDSVVAVGRARQLSDLWRTYLTARTDPDGAGPWRAIGDFYSEERALTSAWDAIRAREMEEPLARTAVLAEYAADMLASIRDTEVKDSPWPFFLDLREHIVRDAERLLGLLANQFRASVA